MIGAGVLLVLVGAFGLLNLWETLPAYWQGWPGWIRPLEVAAFTLPNLAIGVMLARGRAVAVPWATAWTLACLVITIHAIVPWGLWPWPLLGGNAPAFSPLSVLCCNPLPVQYDLAIWSHSLVGIYWQLDNLPVAWWLIPPGVAYLLAAVLLVYVWRKRLHDMQG